MYYCFKGCKNCCKNCGQCCDDCCSGFWDCCGSFCEGIINCISKCFSKPFSFCTFLALFITFLPTVLMIVAEAKAKDYVCSESMTKTALAVQGVNNLVNFCFCLYLVFSFSKKYTGQGKEGSEEKNILQRTMNLICYDFVVCFYIIALVFFIAWVIVGHHYYSQENSKSQCSLYDNGFFMDIFLYNLISMDIYLIGGGLIFIWCLIIAACDEGSCTFYDVCRCQILCCTCGLCDIGKRKQKTNQEYNPNRYQCAQQNRQQYSEQRNTWLDKSKRLLAGFGLLSTKENIIQPQQNNQNRVHQPNQNVHANNQHQQNYQYNNIQQNNIQQNNPYLQNNPYQQNNPFQQQYPFAPQNNMVQQNQPNYNYPQQVNYQMPPPAPLPPQQNSLSQPQNPQHLNYDSNQNQNPFANQPQEEKKEKGFLDKAKDAATELKNKLFKSK